MVVAGEVTGFLAFNIFVAVLGMFQFGYHTGVINAPQQEIIKFINETYTDDNGETMEDKFIDILMSLAVSLFAIGGMIGSLLGGWAADLGGRKNSLLIASSFGVVGSLFMALSKVSHSYELIAVGRFTVGFHCGLSTSIVPLYVSELAPVNLRGALGTINQLAVTFGLVLSQILGIDVILGNGSGWPILLGLTIIPACVQILLLLLCPESPRYLLINKKDEESARKVISKLRGRSDVDCEIDEIRAEDRSQRAVTSVSLFTIFRTPTLRVPLIIGIMMHLSQQFSGINAVFYYSTKIFVSAGWSIDIAQKATIGIGGTMFVMTLVTVPLMDRAGRRTLHLWGLGGMFVSSILMTIALYTYKSSDVMGVLAIVFTFLYCAFFGLGPGSIPWMIMSELFSQGPRPNAVAFGSLINWLSNFIIGFLFPVLQQALDNASFLPFTVLIAMFWLYFYIKLPETKNRTIEEITLLFKR